jgi:hypothetical protein
VLVDARLRTNEIKVGFRNDILQDIYSLSDNYFKYLCFITILFQINCTGTLVRNLTYKGFEVRKFGSACSFD